MKSPSPNPLAPHDRNDAASHDSASAACTGVGPIRAGKVRPMVLLWALGVPVPILLIIFLIRGCA